MTKTIKLLSHGLFEKPFMDSRVKSRTLSKKEEILGHLVGPLGLIFVVNTIAALVEKFFTQQTGAIYGVENLDMVRVMGHQYEVVMTFTKILAVAWGLFVGWLIQHTQSRQGRFRPWHLILAYVLCMMMVGVFEEFLFRGIIAGTLLWHFGMTSRGVWKAVALSGALFGCAHLINLRGSSVTGVLVQCAVTVMVGMVFSAVYFRSGCIWAPVFLHGFVDVAAGSLTGFFDTGTTIAGTVSGYMPIQLLGAVPYIIVLLVILRPSKMAETLALWNRTERPGNGAKAPNAGGKNRRHG